MFEQYIELCDKLAQIGTDMRLHYSINNTTKWWQMANVLQWRTVTRKTMNYKKGRYRNYKKWRYAGEREREREGKEPRRHVLLPI